MLIGPKRLKLRTSNLTHVFPGTVRTWHPQIFPKRRVFKNLLGGDMHSHERLLVDNRTGRVCYALCKLLMTRRNYWRNAVDGHWQGELKQWLRYECSTVNSVLSITIIYCKENQIGFSTPFPKKPVTHKLTYVCKSCLCWNEVKRPTISIDQLFVLVFVKVISVIIKLCAKNPVSAHLTTTTKQGYHCVKEHKHLPITIHIIQIWYQVAGKKYNLLFDSIKKPKINQRNSEVLILWSLCVQTKL